jgi:hypothetical protein
MHQNWGKLLFMHWPIRAEVLRPLIPEQLEIDTFEGSAWIGVVPFTMWGIRASFLPAIPSTSAFHELNVRTYVQYQGVPGVWFFSLDAASRLAVWGARRFYHLPYFNAEMYLRQNGKTIEYSSKRIDALTYGEFFRAERAGFPADLDVHRFRDLARAEIKVNWNIGEPVPLSKPDSLIFFLTERYCLYSLRGGQIYRSRIFHEPWRLNQATIDSYKSTMVESLGLPASTDKAFLHYAHSIAVDIWPLRMVSEARA